MKWTQPLRGEVARILHFGVKMKPLTYMQRFPSSPSTPYNIYPHYMHIRPWPIHLQPGEGGWIRTSAMIKRYPRSLHGMAGRGRRGTTVLPDARID